MSKEFKVVLSVIAGAVVMIVGILAFCLYVVPGFTFMGATVVTMSNQYTNYYGPEIAQIFNPTRRNIIIESSGTPVVVRVRSIGHGDENSITIYEDANGISFNSVDRTHLNILQEVGENNVIYTRIQVIRPKGAVSRSSCVYINLKNENFTPYNFILDNGTSPVTFEHATSVTTLNIDKLVVHGTGHVSLPQTTPSTMFTLTVGELEIKSAGASVDCRSDILRDVTIEGNTRGVTLSRVFGSITVKGSFNNINGVAYVGGSVVFESSAGKFTADEIIGNLKIIAETAPITVQSVASLIDPDDVIEGFGIRNISGSVTVHHVKGNANIHNKLGSVTVHRVNGDANIYMEAGVLNLGRSNVADGVSGNVVINPDSNFPKRAGTTTIYFMPGSLAGILMHAVDGHVNVFRAQGAVHIEVAARGIANVRVEFVAFSPGAKTIIVHGSRRLGGEVRIDLSPGTLGFDLHLEATDERRNRLNSQLLYNTKELNNNGDPIVIFPPIEINGGAPISEIVGGERIKVPGYLVDVRTHSLFTLS